ncbi:MAG: hypothetical protein FJ014_13860 [Chloroflexi bacterium]|nr:hypothetical protein [Chloroflexota bacterium]
MKRVAYWVPRVVWLAAALLVMATTSGPVAAEGPKEAVVYFNQACGDCWTYIQQEVVPILQEGGVTDIASRDYINEPANRPALLKESERLGVPQALQSHLAVFIGERIILEGHIPQHVVRDLLAAPAEAFERIVVYQDKMQGATGYKVWAFKGEIKEYPLDTPIGKYLEWLAEHREDLKPGLPVMSGTPLLLLVLTTGFLDGFNPCAFAVLLFFIAFLFTIQRARSNILQMGAIYIAAIYIAYFLIGLGLLKAVLFTGEHHLMARIGSWLVIGLGLINVKDYLFPELPISLRVPTIAHGTIQDWLQKATVPTAAVGASWWGCVPSPAPGASMWPSLACFQQEQPISRGWVIFRCTT